MKRLLLLLSLIVGIKAMAIDLPPLEYHTVNGIQRSMIVWAPKDLPENAPLVISMHGYNQDAGYQAGQTHWENCADSAKFVIVYPNGIDRAWDLGGTRDIKFIDWIMEEMVSRYNINRNRIYLTGFSMGGMFTYYYIKKQGDKIAAAAPVSGPDGSPSWSGTRRVPILHTHGTADNYSGVYNNVKNWAKSEDLTQEKYIEHYAGRGKAENSKPTSIAMLYSWTSTDPNNKNEVALLAIRDKGHWHSEDVGPGVSTTQEIWKFCKQYSLRPEAPQYKSIKPEDGSFDLTDTDRSFTLALSGKLSVKDVKAQLELEGQTIDLLVTDTEDATTVNFLIPDDVTVADGTYTLNISNILNPEGGEPAAYSFTYSFGNTTAGDAYKARLASLLDRGWYAYNNTEDGTLMSVNNARKRLKNNLELYADWSSTKPSAYENVCDKLERDIVILENYIANSITDVCVDEAVSIQYYNVDGRPVDRLTNGMYIVVKNADGVTTVEKAFVK